MLLKLLVFAYSCRPPPRGQGDTAGFIKRIEKAERVRATPRALQLHSLWRIPTAAVS